MYTEFKYIKLIFIFYTFIYSFVQGFPGGASGKEPACQCRRCKRPGFSPWGEKIPWRRKCQPTPMFSPGESYGQWGLAGYSPWGHKELDMTEQLGMHTLICLSEKIWKKYGLGMLIVQTQHTVPFSHIKYIAQPTINLRIPQQSEKERR